MKKQNFQAFLVLLFFLFLFLSSFSASAARLPLPKQGEKEVKANDVILSTIELKDEMEVRDEMELMGLEECDDERDEECFSRRMTVEAHLDYIYTQEHKP